MGATDVLLGAILIVAVAAVWRAEVRHGETLGLLNALGDMLGEPVDCYLKDRREAKDAQ